jgi:hypothetical protein
MLASCSWTAACCVPHTLANLLERYAATIVPHKRSADRERYMLRVVLRHPMARGWAAFFWKSGPEKGTRSARGPSSCQSGCFACGKKPPCE